MSVGWCKDGDVVAFDGENSGRAYIGRVHGDEDHPLDRVIVKPTHAFHDGLGWRECRGALWTQWCGPTDCVVLASSTVRALLAESEGP